MTEGTLQPPSVDNERSVKADIIRVLHVDDEVGLLKTTKQILEMQGPFQVDLATSVEEAYEKIGKLIEENFESIYLGLEKAAESGEPIFTKCELIFGSRMISASVFSITSFFAR